MFSPITKHLKQIERKLGYNKKEDTRDSIKKEDIDYDGETDMKFLTPSSLDNELPKISDEAMETEDLFLTPTKSISDDKNKFDF